MPPPFDDMDIPLLPTLVCSYDATNAITIPIGKELT
jgi:hypothetical protein